MKFALLDSNALPQLRQHACLDLHTLLALRPLAPPVLLMPCAYQLRCHLSRVLQDTRVTQEPILALHVLPARSVQTQQLRIPAHPVLILLLEPLHAPPVLRDLSVQQLMHSQLHVLPESTQQVVLRAARPVRQEAHAQQQKALTK